MPEKKSSDLRRHRSASVLVVSAVAAALLVFLLDWGGLLRPLENRAYDGLFYLRAKTRPHPLKADSPVVIVGADEKTFADERFFIPVPLWHNYWSAVILGLADGGARAIGLDYVLPRALFDNIAPDSSRVWLKTILMAKRKNAPLITGYIDVPGQPYLPEKRFIQILGLDNLGIFNIETDSDDFIRRAKLFFPSADDPKKGSYSFTFLLAKAYQPDLTLPRRNVYIDYNPSDDPFPRYSLVDVYDRAAAGDTAFFKEHFKDKIVLIGETDLQSADRHPTPLYYLTKSLARRTSGVEILGHTINTLLAGRFFDPAPPWARALIYLGLALAVGWLMIYTSPRLSLSLFAPALIAGYFAAAFGFYLHYVILPAAGGLAAILINQTASFAYRYLVVDREKRMVRSAFSRYLSPDVVHEVLENPDQLTLGGSRRTMTVFFSDLAGFTGISETLPPEDLVHLLNRYLSRMTRAIMNRGGTVDKFEGDAIMAFWGAPTQQEDHALRACLSALEQQNLLAAFRDEILAEGLPELKARMGINTGPMIVGNMGSEDRFDYTVMGDAVNLASRLEGANKSFGTHIMISETTYDLVKARLEARELDLLRVKGRGEPIRVYELLAETGGLPDEKRRMLGIYKEGLSLYRTMRFAEAEEAFARVMELEPEDGPSRTYLERCRAFRAQPPPADWDGVFTMTTK